MKHAAVLLISSALLVACGQDTASAPAAAPATLPFSAGAVKPEAPQAPRIKGDASRPLEQYQVIDSGDMLLALTHTDRPEGPNLEELATALSERYSRENDGFKRQDILKAIQPEIESLLLKARSQRYLAMDIRAAYEVETYDFGSKSFELRLFGNSYSRHYFNDHPSASVAFFNKSDFRHMRVEDETAARRIEALRGKDGMTLRVYFFVPGFNSLNSNLDAQVMAVALLDRDGKTIAVQKGV